MKNITKAVSEKLLTPPPPKMENVGVKLPVDHIAVLDALAAKSGKSRGAVAKIILELGIVQMGYEWGCLTADLQDFYTGILVKGSQK